MIIAVVVVVVVVVALISRAHSHAMTRLRAPDGTIAERIGKFVPDCAQEPVRKCTRKGV